MKERLSRLTCLQILCAKICVASKQLWKQRFVFLRDVFLLWCSKALGLHLLSATSPRFCNQFGSSNFINIACSTETISDLLVSFESRLQKVIPVPWRYQADLCSLSCKYCAVCKCLFANTNCVKGCRVTIAEKGHSIAKSVLNTSYVDAIPVQSLVVDIFASLSR